MAIIPAAEWLPDQSPYQSPGSPNVSNVTPAPIGYRPFNAFAVYSTSALNARCQGLWYGRAIDGSARVFAGTATKLYALSGTAWNDVTRSSGGAYACASDAMWSFAQFGDTLIATNGTDAPQKFTLSSAVDGSVKFAALGGSPSVAEFVTTIKDFVFFGKISGAKSKVRWSAINNADDYTASATTMSDSQTIPDGGNIRGVVGGEFGVVLQDDAINRFTFQTTGEIFRRDKIATNVGCSIQGSVAYHANRIFFAHRSGFYMLVDGQQLVPIGAEKVDRTFWETVNQSYLSRVTAAVDPLNSLYLVSFPDADASAGTPNTIWAYHWEAQKWSQASPGNHEMIATGSQQGAIDLDTADSFADDIDVAGAPSLDSELYAGQVVPILTAFNTSHYYMLQNGAALEATVDTAEQQPIPNGVAFVRSARPVVNGTSASPTLAIGYRDNTTDAVSFTDASSQNSRTGLCNFRTRARYIRGRIVVPASSTWTHIQGIDDVTAEAVGWR